MFYIHSHLKERMIWNVSIGWITNWMNTVEFYIDQKKFRLIRMNKSVKKCMFLFNRFLEVIYFSHLNRFVLRWAEIWIDGWLSIFSDVEWEIELSWKCFSEWSSWFENDQNMWHKKRIIWENEKKGRSYSDVDEGLLNHCFPRLNLTYNRSENCICCLSKNFVSLSRFFSHKLWCIS
jgi:hypothetical protein